MGCFSFLCKESGIPALSTSFDGSPCHLFLLKDGKVLEHMYGNYDSYGRVFKKGMNDSFEWSMPWTKVCRLMFNSNPGDGIAMVLHDYYTGEFPTTKSDDDPNQGWGSDDLELMGDTSKGSFLEVKEPFHKVYTESDEQDPSPQQELDELKGRISLTKEDYERRLESAKGMLRDFNEEKEPPNSTTLSAIHRLNQKVSEYKTIIGELNKLI